MSSFSLRSLLLAAIVLSNCISWTASRHHYTHNVSGHRSRHRRQGAGLYLSASYVLPGGEGAGWGDWGEVSPCSRTCGGGVASQKRICLQLGPDGKPQCTGGDTKYFSCETQDCPAGSPDFRAQQCSEFDDVLFRDVKYRWVPYTQAPNPCELNCMPHGERFYYRHRTKVVDGTRCNDESFDVCVDGTCQPVGCDMMLGSSAREDKCRECRGSGANCQTTSGVIDTDDLRKGYNDVLLIPDSATNVVIAERGPSRNYLALHAKNGTYYLNGEYQIDFPRSLTIAGALWYYERSQQGLAAPDKLRCLGPTDEPLILSLLLQDENVGIEYEYSLPNERAPPKNKEYNWAHEEFSPCSAPCGGGYQTRNVSCRSREELELVDEVLCDKDLKPPTNQTCNTEPCEAQWTPEPWGECSKRCGEGGTRSRTIHCTQVISNGYPSIVGDKTCFNIHGPKPPQHETCNENATCPIWFTGPWKPCDKLCDEGKQTRQVVCYQQNGSRKEILNDKECQDEKPPTEQSCMLQPCEGVDWVLTEWTGCDSCLSTVRTRTAVCTTKDATVVNDTFCAYHATPVTEEPCDRTKLPACEVQWYATQWSDCSVDCGKGIQTRKVFCGLFDGASVLKVDDSRCVEEDKYNSTKECEVPEDKCPSKFYAGPWGVCDKKCGGGEQYREVMCLRAGKPATDCTEKTMVSDSQACNTEPCDKDELLSVNKTLPPPDEDYEDCIQEEEFEEVGLDSDLIPPTVDDFLSSMFSDSPTEGSGTSELWSSTSPAEHESTFPESSPTDEEFLTTGTGETSDLTDFSGSGDYSTTSDYGDSSASDLDTDFTTVSGSEDTTAPSNETASTAAEEATTNLKKLEKIIAKETMDSDESYFDSLEDEYGEDDDDYDDDDDYSFYSDSTEYTDETKSGSTEDEWVSTTKSGETSESEESSESEPSVSRLESTDLTSSTLEDGATKLEGTREAGETTSETEPIVVTSSTEPSETTEFSSTAPSETTESGSTEPSKTAESGSTEPSETPKLDSTESLEITASGSTEPSETTASGSTELSETTESGSTELSETTESSNTEPSETTESGSTEPSETTESENTEPSRTTETSSTEISETTASGSTEPTETTESGSTGLSETTQSGSTEPSETTESSSEEPSETTESGSTEPTDTTEFSSTESKETAESSSTEPTETTESVSTESSETTESGSTELSETTTYGSTEPLKTTESESTEPSETTEPSSIEPSETTESGSTESSETTESGSTEPSETTKSESTESLETTEYGSTEPSETTESGSTEPLETTEYGSTESSETTESGSTESIETTVSGSTELSETTESDSTEPSETTESGSTELSETTESGSTEPSETTESGSTESLETTESGSTETTGSTEATESTSESATTEPLSGTTRWDLTSAVEEFTTKKARICRPRSCIHTDFGCCPDKKTPALGPFDAGCPKPRTCADSRYGCCPDNLSPAKGPLYKGCPVEPCAETLFGCCESDNITAAQGNDQEGCPPPPPACMSSKYGCCNDKTEAKGPEKEGCPETSTTFTSTTTSEDYTESTEGSESTTKASIETKDSTDTEDSTGSEGSTKPEGCNESEFGCCFDYRTPATGPGPQGCPCHASQFGCCPDGVSSAQGPNSEGCVKSCNTSAFGCCPDGESPAHGPDNEGCCLNTRFGCCPDNYKPAEGPHLEGCGCQYSRFGCCPDNVTIAAGPNNKGCGCQYAEYGCCPDRHTDASGPDFDGCLCHTYQFGCCPDGVTIAEGPNGQGCYCQYSKFGCCGDEQTHAIGPNHQGCDCATSKYGCCLDGITEATGPKFEGCTDKPLDRQAACGLTYERGSCRNYSVGWYYDTEYGGCSRFWYGGCEGNANRFNSKEECEDICVSPPPKDACRLPQVKGACTGYNQRWYYDTEREMCSNFIYGGCLGNANNFESRELCQAQCEPDTALDQCSLTIERGSCAGNYLRWGYNKETKSCDQFIWGGCEGNSNRFTSEAACMLRCNPPGEPQPECSEAQDKGNCTDTEARWSFSQTENRCVPFYYSGCGGNGNKYTTREACEHACPSAYEPELCTLPAATGDCYDYREKWYFDTKTQRCGMFYYGGCGGNENRFNSEQECVNRCIPPTTTVAPPTAAAAPHPAPDAEAYCFMEIDAGPCNHNVTTKWGYDYTRGKCVSFQFGGCGGNQNNFLSEEICAYYCKPAQDICQLPMLSGPCDESVMRWFYDAATDSCSQFTYGGCDGNDNRFETREECESRCKSAPAPAVSTTTPTAKEETMPSECVVSPVLEPCNREAAAEVWYYNEASTECTSHQNVESGMECRNTGVFYSQEACERSCGVFRNIDVCQYDKEPGPCHDYRSKYFYNRNTSRCEEFAYGGCFGGANRFSTEQECEQICMTSVDPCTLPPESGNCVGHYVMWYYRPESDQCDQFVFGGCGGNDNKFESREACEGRCRRQPPLTTTLAPTHSTRQPEPEECRTPESLAPCGSNETVFYFDVATRSCKAADIGGCGSSAKLYRSEEACERSCGAFRGIDVCRAGLDPGPCRGAFPKFYFDAASGSCRDFTYGGCQGGPNRFSTMEECQHVCASAGPAAVCLLPVETGEACGEVPERRWHYDVTLAGCLVFSYQGCGGNANNFRSYEECAYYCTPEAPEPPGVCDRYTEECAAIEQTCVFGMKVYMTAEGCTRCECKEPVSCDAHLRECDALRCRYGIERTALPDGCIKCKCLEDPCSRNPCAPTERCAVVASRNSVRLEVVYSAQCESNEIVSDCAEYELECSRLSCRYAIQRTRVGSCERCSCVREETNCTVLQQDCERLRCHYGLLRTMDDDGCERCACLKPPCETKVCPAGERCISTPFRDPATYETRYAATCKPVSKPGACPAGDEPVSRSTESSCRQECADDADCRGIMKCCAHGCSQLCLPPAPPTTPQPSTTHTPDVPRAPEAYSDTEHNQPQVEAAEGGKATLRCYFHGNPPPKITWRFGEVTIEGDAGRYRLLSDGALEIISLYRNDSGVYICVAQNEYGSAEQQVTLTVADPVETPAAVASAEGRVTGELGNVLVVHCPVYGYPMPTIFWYRNNEMVPYSNALYEARGLELQIRRLAIATLGEYECQAYNGFGKPATWRVVVQAYRPPGETRRSPYLVGREVRVTPRPPTTAPTTLAPTITTEKPFFTVAPYIVPVHTSLPATSSGSVGSQISLVCEVDGYPDPEVRWTKDDASVVPGDRIWIAGSRLTIERAEVSDSGLYSCVATNMYNSHSSTVQVTVKELLIPATCVDNPTFANCALIVQSRFCYHKYYSTFCCKSCVEAGQLDPRDALMQADQTFRK